MSSKVVSPSVNNNSSSMPWSGGSTRKVTTLPPNNNSNNRRKNTNENNNNNASNNSVVDGTMMRSLSLSSNSSQQSRNHHNNHNNHNNHNHHHHHNRASSTSPSGNGNNNNKKNSKDGSLLFDYSMQVPYEGVKPSEANEPQKPHHILELYDFAESDELMDIALLNATIKRVSPSNNSPNKKPTILAIFRNAREANKAVQSFRGVRFKIKTWEPLVKTNNGSPPATSGQVPASTINLSPTSSTTTNNNKTNIEGNYEKHQQQSLMNVSRGVTLSGRQQ
ncbi:hypothetical protein C1645_770484 [Glomus cerebriforme]|uniref:Uncharacterized protein n=1 Tax=Glomus cerebriforme TaxID=658196 RepID=A0A397SX35_9GLOM|nr:hypothetical protein C1645_770484 [Glomus cerebriforme]